MPMYTQTQYSHLFYVSTVLINSYLDCMAFSIVRLDFDFDVLLGTVVSKSGRSLLIFMLGISTPTLLVIQQFTKVLILLSEVARIQLEHWAVAFQIGTSPSDLERRG